MDLLFPKEERIQERGEDTDPTDEGTFSGNRYAP